MGKYQVMKRASEVDVSTVIYKAGTMKGLVIQMHVGLLNFIHTHENVPFTWFSILLQPLI